MSNNLSEKLQSDLLKLKKWRGTVKAVVNELKARGIKGIGTGSYRTYTLPHAKPTVHTPRLAKEVGEFLAALERENPIGTSVPALPEVSRKDRLRERECSPEDDIKQEWKLNAATIRDNRNVFNVLMSTFYGINENAKKGKGSGDVVVRVRTCGPVINTAPLIDKELAQVTLDGVTVDLLIIPEWIPDQLIKLSELDKQKKCLAKYENGMPPIWSLRWLIIVRSTSARSQKTYPHII